jgi:leucyl-tRNA synthetase
MPEYRPQEIEPKWQNYWEQHHTFKTTSSDEKAKFYVLDMFPYPSGAGLHVGHPLGYIATDIVARYKKHKGFHVLHPAGFDAFGLPAEQYAIQTGQHPAITTTQNISTYKKQLRRIGFNYDWSREVQTCAPEYYRWTQWIFIQIFHSWFNMETQKAEPVSRLIERFSSEGNAKVKAAADVQPDVFSAEDWNAYPEKKQQSILLHYRLAYLAETTVNWCPALGTVLSNDEVKDGFSERGGHPVERKNMLQWMMRITAYADRLLQGLEEIEWPDPVKEMQRHWIGKSRGAQVFFPLQAGEGAIEVFTTRPDTLFGVTFVTIAPEHEWVEQLTKPEQAKAVKEYVEKAKNRSERDRMSDVKTISGVFTGSYVLHPFTSAPLPIWVGDYVLAGYGTGAVMAVPAHDSRDFAFAKHFGLPVKQVIEPAQSHDFSLAAWDEKHGAMINSSFLDGLEVPEAIDRCIQQLEAGQAGKGRTNFRLRDAIFTRQRYWGEPLPVYFKDGMPYTLPEEELPLLLPEIDKFLPTESGEPPLGRANNWNYQPGKGIVENGAGYPLELSTMPGWAGSSWYWFRYMDAQNNGVFSGKEALDFWGQVDLYMGGAEHATGHLLYSRFWCKVLYDLGFVPVEEPFKKLVNQGMIQGRSELINVLTLEHKDYPLAKQTQINTNEIGTYSRNIMIFTDEGIEQKNIGLFSGPFFYSSDIISEIVTELNTGFTDHLTYSSYRLYADIKYIDQMNSNYGIVKKESLDSFLNYLKNTNSSIPVLVTKGGYYINNEFIQTNSKGNDRFLTTSEIEKMSKSKYNVVNPDEICDSYGADTLRLYEMFLGPIEQSKPWSTHGIDGVHRFLKKFWNLFHDEQFNFQVNDQSPTKEELKALHKTIKKVEEDMEKLSFNTTVSAFMICVNELSALKCKKRSVLEPLAVLISPFAPHIAEELWSQLGHNTSISSAAFPQWNEEYLIENTFNYPVSINGKHRANVELALDLTPQEIEKAALQLEPVQKWMEGKPAKKVVVVPGRIINIVI